MWLGKPDDLENHNFFTCILSHKVGLSLAHIAHCDSLFLFQGLRSRVQIKSPKSHTINLWPLWFIICPVPFEHLDCKIGIRSSSSDMQFLLLSLRPFACSTYSFLSFLCGWALIHLRPILNQAGKVKVRPQCPLISSVPVIPLLCSLSWLAWRNKKICLHEECSLCRERSNSRCPCRKKPFSSKHRHADGLLKSGEAHGQRVPQEENSKEKAADWMVLTFFQPLPRTPALPASYQLGILYYLLSPKWGWGRDRLSKGVSTQSAAAALSSGSILETWHSRTGVLWNLADYIMAICDWAVVDISPDKAGSSGLISGERSHSPPGALCLTSLGQKLGFCN